MVGAGTGGEEEKEGVCGFGGKVVVGLAEMERRKRTERVLGFRLKKRGPNMGFDYESMRRSGGLKTDDIGKRVFWSADTSIFHSLFTQNYTWSKKLELMEE